MSSENRNTEADSLFATRKRKQQEEQAERERQAALERQKAEAEAEIKRLEALQEESRRRKQQEEAAERALQEKHAQEKALMEAELRKLEEERKAAEEQKRAAEAQRVAAEQQQRAAEQQKNAAAVQKNTAPQAKKSAPVAVADGDAAAKKKRLIMIAAGAALLVVIIVIIIIVSSSGGSKESDFTKDLATPNWVSYDDGAGRLTATVPDVFKDNGGDLVYTSSSGQTAHMMIGFVCRSADVTSDQETIFPALAQKSLERFFGQTSGVTMGTADETLGTYYYADCTDNSGAEPVFYTCQIEERGDYYFVVAVSVDQKTELDVNYAKTIARSVLGHIIPNDAVLEEMLGQSGDGQQTFMAALLACDEYLEGECNQSGLEVRYPRFMTFLPEIDAITYQSLETPREDAVFGVVVLGPTNDYANWTGEQFLEQAYGLLNGREPLDNVAWTNEDIGSANIAFLVEYEDRGETHVFVYSYVPQGGLLYLLMVDYGVETEYDSCINEYENLHVTFSNAAYSFYLAPNAG